MTLKLIKSDKPTEGPWGGIEINTEGVVLTERILNEAYVKMFNNPRLVWDDNKKEPFEIKIVDLCPPICDNN